MTENSHHDACVPATAIARAGHAVLLRGKSGSGKSDLALRALCRPCLLPGEHQPGSFQLISDDQTILKRAGGAVHASAPATIRGLLEVRGIGVLPFPAVADIPVALVADLVGDVTSGLNSAPIERLPDYPGQTTELLGLSIDLVRIAPFEASAPLKLALALARSVAAGSCKPVSRKP
jgi:serine kinase of HPr protein (carbohydrate metabolism regulator)